MTKKLLVIILSVFNPYVHSNVNDQPSFDIKKEAHTWVSTYITPMTEQEIYLTANILYFLSANAIIESRIKEFTVPFIQLHQSINTHISSNSNPVQDLTTIKKLIERLIIIAQAREIYIQSWNHCEATALSPHIQKSLDALQSCGREIIISITDDNSELVRENITSITQKIKQNNDQLNKITTFYSNLATEIDLSQKDSPLVTLDAIDRIINSNPAISTVMNNYVNITADLFNFVTINVLSIGTEIYKAHYQALYEYIHTSMGTNNNAYITFGMYGVLSEDEWTPLPHPDVLFLHILQTIKQYTKTEFIQ